MIIVLYIYLIYNLLTGILFYFLSKRPIANKFLDIAREKSNDELIAAFRKTDKRGIVVQAIILILMMIFL